MCEEETPTGTEPSSPPVESKTMDDEVGGASTMNFIAEHDSPITRNGSQGPSTATAPSLQKEPALQEEAQGACNKINIVYAGHGEDRPRDTKTESALEVQQQPQSFKDVWEDTFDTELERMMGLLTQENCKWYVAVDTEFCMKDEVVSPQGGPQSADAHYEQARRIVDEGDLVQVGFAIADSRLGLERDSFLVFQFNICFDYMARSSTSTNIRFLRDVAKLNLADHATRGIKLRNFMDGMNSLGIFGNRNIIWITFQGYSDFGYLIRGIQNSCVLTSSRTEFIRLAKGYFPSSYDLKLFLTLGIRCRKSSQSVRGSASLKGLASSLGVQRSGEEHGSGSDSHLTLGCFSNMMLSDGAAASELRRYKNIIYGVESPLPTRAHVNADVDHVHVRASNFHNQIMIFRLSLGVPCLLTAEVLLADSTVNQQQLVSYSQARTQASRCQADLALGFSDQHGRLAFGRIWIFHVQAQGAGNEEQSNEINPAMLAELLTSMGSLHNANVSWLSSSTGCYLYLVSLLTRCLPLEEHGFFALWRCFFPSSHLIQHGSPEQNPGRRAIITLRQMIGNSHFP